jgi:multidrug resistance efflux pump
MTRRRLVLILVMLAIVAGGVATFNVARARLAAVAADPGPVVPTLRVAKQSLDLTVHMTGELRAARQQTLMAPSIGGGTLRLLKLADVGQPVKEGEVIIEFDPADQLYALEQAESELLEAEQEIIKRRADTEAQAAQDKVALLNAQAAVRRAELDASVEQDLIPANEYKIRQAALVEARRALAQTEQDVAGRASMNKASLSVLEEKRTKARIGADRARQNIDSLVITAPMDGVTSPRDNYDATGGVMWSGMVLPPYRVGDSVSPGRQVLDIYDTSGMEIRASVNEQDRANVEPGQVVEVTSNALPDVTLKGKVVNVSGLGRQERRAGPLRQFEVTFRLEGSHPGLLPGTSVDLVTTGKKVENVLVLPRQAVFEKDGQPIVYERVGAGAFEARTIKVLHRTESRIAIDGIAEGVEIALLNPESAGRATGAGPAAAPPVAPGGPPR